MTFNLDDLLAKSYSLQLLLPVEIKQVCEKLKELLVLQGNVKMVTAPVTIVGDVHGQFHDVLEIFKIGGRCPSTNYIFLGDYVDRGHHSVEVITLLACLKLRYPNRVTLVRGNHESRAVTATYGFYTECTKKFGDAQVWNYFTDLFDYLILAAVIDDTILCVHGGLSPSIHTLDQIRVLDRFKEIPHEGPMADLVWSDPVPSSLHAGDNGLFSLSPRGAGYVFGRQVTQKFLSLNNLSHICRAHQICMEGYQILFDDLLSTVWSAPNYCYRAGNLASILEVGCGLERYYNVFGACPDNERTSPGMPAPSTKFNRLAELLDPDGVDEKRRMIGAAGQGSGHFIENGGSSFSFTASALMADEDAGIDVIGGGGRNNTTIDQYFT